MEFFSHHSWKLISKLENILGTWPYEIKKRHLLLQIVYTLIFISFMIPVVDIRIF